MNRDRELQQAENEYDEFFGAAPAHDEKTTHDDELRKEVAKHPEWLNSEFEDEDTKNLDF